MEQPAVESLAFCAADQTQASAVSLKFWLQIYWLAMPRLLWIGFYALALVVFVGLTLASLIACVNGVVTHLWFECLTLPLIPMMAWFSWMTLDLLRRKLRPINGDDSSGSKMIEADPGRQEQNPEANPSKNGEWQGAAFAVLALAAIIAILWLANRSGIFIAAFLVLFYVSVPFGNKLIGLATAVQLTSPKVERQSERRYYPEIKQLTRLGFKPLFIFGESRSLYRLFLVYPAYLYAVMLLNREIATVQGSRLIFGNPVLISEDGKTYVYVMRLGFKFYTRFQDGDILLTKSFGGNTKFPSNVIFQRRCDGSIKEIFMEHQNRAVQLEAVGKQAVEDVSFDAFSQIWAQG